MFQTNIQELTLLDLEIEQQLLDTCSWPKMPEMFAPQLFLLYIYLFSSFDLNLPNDFVI
jgi:hypothetical protein